MKSFVLAAAFVVTAGSTAFAQYVPLPASPYYGSGYYDQEPGYYVAAAYQPYGYGYYGYDRPNPYWSNNTNRGGPGPRVGAGGGAGVGAQR